MRVKLFEVRDDGTCIVAIAIKPQRDVGRCADEIATRKWLLRRSGWWGETGAVLFGSLEGGRLCCDPYDWPENPRTMRAAHVYVEAHFDELADGQVVDVRVPLGLRDAPVESDRLYRPEI